MLRNRDEAQRYCFGMRTLTGPEIISLGAKAYVSGRREYKNTFNPIIAPCVSYFLQKNKTILQGADGDFSALAIGKTLQT